MSVIDWMYFQLEVGCLHMGLAHVYELKKVQTAQGLCLDVYLAHSVERFPMPFDKEVTAQYGGITLLRALSGERYFFHGKVSHAEWLEMHKQADSGAVKAT